MTATGWPGRQYFGRQVLNSATVPSAELVATPTMPDIATPFGADPIANVTGTYALGFTDIDARAVDSQDPLIATTSRGTIRNERFIVASRYGLRGDSSIDQRQFTNVMRTPTCMLCAHACMQACQAGVGRGSQHWDMAGLTMRCRDGARSGSLEHRGAFPWAVTVTLVAWVGWRRASGAPFGEVGV